VSKSGFLRTKLASKKLLYSLDHTWIIFNCQGERWHKKCEIWEKQNRCVCT